MTTLCEGCLLADDCPIRDELLRIEQELEAKTAVTSCQSYEPDEFARLDEEL